MKTLRKLSVLAAALLLAAPVARGQSSGTFGPLPAVIPPGTTTNLACNALFLHTSQGVGLLVDFAMTPAGTNGTSVLTFQVSPDSNTWSTVGAPVVTLAGAGTTRVTGYTNLPAAALANMLYLRPYTWQNNGTNTLYPTNLLWNVTDPPAR